MSAPLILGVDPGTEKSGWALFKPAPDPKVVDSGVLTNPEIFYLLRNAGSSSVVAIEMIASYGMAVGKEVFETCVWIGRFQQACASPGAVRLVYRKDVKMHLCGTPRAKDANIRQALIDLIGPQGKKNDRGPTYGVKSHAWAALGVAVTVAAQIEANVVR